MELRKRKIDSPKNTFDSKVVKRNKKNQNVFLNPLFMTEIVPKILDYLEIESLKDSRLVCSFWGFEGGKILLQKANIKLSCFVTKNGNTLKESKQLENFLSVKGVSATFNSTIENMGNPDTLKNTLPLLLQQTTVLSLNPYNYLDGHRRLAKFLAFFPNLQILHLCSIWFTIREDFATDIQRALVTKFESLKEIRFKSEKNISPYLNDLLLEMKNELAVKEIHLQDNSPFFKVYLESGCSWPIDTLVLQIGSYSPEVLNNVQAFIQKISGTLKHLEWAFYRSQNVPAEYLIPWANSLSNPSTFSQLETLLVYSMSWYVPCSNFSWLLFGCALQLPNLKKLTVNEVPKNLEGRIREWNNHPAASGRTLKNESLVELNIFQVPDEHPKIPVESFVIFSPRIWPNLKELYIEHPPDDLPTSFLLSEWIGLERLDLKFGTMDKKNAMLWKKWLAGGKKSRNAKAEDSILTLKDLRDLKHFGLWKDGDKKSSRIATDILVERSFKFMTQLQSLYLENSKISRGVQKMLKETLGSTVNIEFQ